MQNIRTLIGRSVLGQTADQERHGLLDRILGLRRIDTELRGNRLDVRLIEMAQDFAGNIGHGVCSLRDRQHSAAPSWSR